MIDSSRREMFVDLYHMAEYYEKPPFKSGDIDWNASWFDDAAKKVLTPFLNKYKGDKLANDLAMSIISEADRMAVAANKEVLK